LARQKQRSIVFVCPFLCFFLLDKQKKENTSDQARDIYTKEKIAWACTNPTTFFNASGLFLFVSRQKE